MALNLSRDTLLVEFVLMNTASIGQSRRVEDANLAKCKAYFEYSQTLLLTNILFLLDNS